MVVFYYKYFKVCQKKSKCKSTEKSEIQLSNDAWLIEIFDWLKFYKIPIRQNVLSYLWTKFWMNIWQ